MPELGETKSGDLCDICGEIDIKVYRSNYDGDMYNFYGKLSHCDGCKNRICPNCRDDLYSNEGVWVLVFCKKCRGKA